MSIQTKHRKIIDGYKLEETEFNVRRHDLETKANGHQVPVVWDSAVDYNVLDKQGNKWIDMTAGIFAANAGHSNPKIKEAIQRQLDKNLIFAYQYITEIRQQFVEKL